MINTDLSVFVHKMHSVLREQYIQSLGRMTSQLDVRFARTLMRCDNKPL